VGEIGIKHRQSNICALRRFAADCKEKLEPFWQAQVVPYLESSAVLQFALPEQQDRWMRGVVLGGMKALHKHSLIDGIPQKYERGTALSDTQPTRNPVAFSVLLAPLLTLKVWL